MFMNETKNAEINILRRLGALALGIVMLMMLPVSALAEDAVSYKLNYILNQKTFGGEDTYDMNNTATGDIYYIAGSSTDAITDYNYEAGFKIKLSNPGAKSIVPIQLMGSSNSYNLWGNVKFEAYEKHGYAYRLLLGNTKLADKDDGLITDGKTWNDIRFVIRETPSDGDVTTTTDDTVSYDLYINGSLVTTQENVAVGGLNGDQAAKRNPYRLNFKHYTNAGNSILIDDVWIANYVPYEPTAAYKLKYTLNVTDFDGNDTYDLINTAKDVTYEISTKSTNAITDYNYEAGFKIKLSNPGTDSTISVQLMGSASYNLLGNVKFVSYSKHDYDYRLLRANTLLADRDDGLVTDGKTWNDIRFVIRETPSDGDVTTTTDDTVSYDLYINGSLVMTQENVAVGGLNGDQAAKRNPYRLNFKHNIYAGNSALIDDVWIAKYVPSYMEWEFDDAVELKSYWMSDSKQYKVENGTLIYTAPAEAEEAALTYTPAAAIDNSVFSGVKVKMKHNYSDSSVTSGEMKLCLAGTATIDGAETAFDYTTGAVTAALGAASNDFITYEFALNEILGELNISNASITSLKLLPMDAAGNYEIDSIRLVDTLASPLDASKMSLHYSFDDTVAGNAMGTISLDFGGQRSASADTVVLYWANGNQTEGYTPLADYTRIISLTGSEAEKGYTITKNMMIPETAEVLLARITDMEKTFDVVCQIPAEKLLEEKEPDMIIALTSDFHFGDPNYMTHSASEKMLKAREQLDNHADAIIVGGDTVDTFGGRSWYTVRGMNGLAGYGYRMDPNEEESDEVTLTYYQTETKTDENGDSYKVLTDTPTGRVETVTNTDAYDLAYDYFTGFNKPVYLAEGNHESPEAAYLDYIGVSPQRMKRLLSRFIDWSVANGKYPDPIERRVDIYDNLYEESISYDDYITDAEGNEYHCIFLRNFGSERPVKWLTDEELDWLDQKLYENESTGKPIFLMSHLMPVRHKAGKVESYGYYGLNFPAFEKIINKHPSVVVVSGHTHQSLDQDNQSYYNGAENEPSFISVPAMKHSWINDSEVDAAYAMLVYAELYDDKIIARGYETTTELTPARGVGQITRKPIPTAMGSILVSRTQNADGTITLTASCNDAAATYEWILAGEKQSGNSVTLSSDYEGYIAVRATDKNGNYISDSFSGLYDEELMGQEEKTYFAISGQKNGYNPLTDESGEAAVWASGIGGKNVLDEAAHLNATDATNVSYQLKNVWTKQNPESGYLVADFDIMPQNSDSADIYVSSGDTRLSADLAKELLSNQWNHITVVCDLSGKTANTYANGKLVGTVSATPNEGSYLTFGIESIEAATLEGYLDGLVVYETDSEPILSTRIEKGFAELTDNTALYSEEQKTLYLPGGTLCKELSEQMEGVVVSANGHNKAGDSEISDGDFLVYYDLNSGHYVFYTVKLYADYDRIVLSGTVANDNIVLYVNAKTAGDTVVMAYYDSEEHFVGCEYTAQTVVGLNKISVNVSEGAHHAKVMLWKNMDTIAPLTEALPVE